MSVEWGEAKRQSNIVEHGIDFEDAALIFASPVIEAEDDREDYGEIRIRALGHLDGVFYMVVYTWRGQNGALSAHGKWMRMADEDIRQFSLEDLKARRAGRKSATRADAPALPIDADFWAAARVVIPDRGKAPVNLRVDRDVLDWFRAQGKGHLTRMNAVLRSYVEAQKLRD